MQLYEPPTSEIEAERVRDANAKSGWGMWKGGVLVRFKALKYAIYSFWL